MRSTLDHIATALRQIIAPIPARPASVQTVKTETAILTPEQARRAASPTAQNACV